MNLLLALVCGVLGYFVSQLVFNDPISFVIGVIIFIVIAFGDRVRRVN